LNSNFFFYHFFIRKEFIKNRCFAPKILLCCEYYHLNGAALLNDSKIYGDEQGVGPFFHIVHIMVHIVNKITKSKECTANLRPCTDISPLVNVCKKTGKLK